MDRSTYRCELCESPAGSVIAVGRDFEYETLPDDFQYSLCPSCKHLFLQCRPSESEIGSIYPPTYYTVNPKSPLFLRGSIYRHKVRMDAARILKVIRSRKKRSVLDVGCGDCARLMSIRHSSIGPGMELAGLDLQFSEEVAGAAKAADIDLIEGNVESVPLGEKRYDLVLMSQLIEHLYAPRRTLQTVFNLLNPGGILVIETPQWKCLDFLLFKKRYWGGYHFPRHFNIFSASSLKRFVESCGFEIREHGFLPSPGFWIMSLRNMLGMNSRESSNSVFEFINFSCLPVVAFFVLLDKLRMLLGGRTSNQFVIAQRPGSTEGKPGQ